MTWPINALQVPIATVIRQLERQYGGAVSEALNPLAVIPGPVARHSDTTWLKTANTVGINVRTIRHFWNIIPYALQLPNAQNAIHILPIWEPGVVSSLYGPSSWNINPEFFCSEMERTLPGLDTVEKQLKVVVNLLHVMGKTVGMDVVPHTDRFSEQSLANPRFFEWLQRRDTEIMRYSGDLYADVQMTILAWLLEQGSAVEGLEIPADPAVFFEKMPEQERLYRLFGEKKDYAGRLNRRKLLLQQLYDEGYETVPATMGPPYRGIEVDPDPSAIQQDEEGRIWRDYKIINPQPMSRVFGPLARYRLYESKDNNRNWEVDFDQPVPEAWAYVCEHYRQLQVEYQFDFMRGDMSHVQMRPSGVPATPVDYYDLQGAVKEYIRRDAPYFGYFAESFLVPPNEMAYGDECDHLEAALADSTLGNLQSEPVGTAKFLKEFWQYRIWLDSRKFAPNFTIFTADKDDPRFDWFYLDGNEIRYFLALFLTDMPSYMGLGFECRDPHPEPAPNEFYSKLYVFQLSGGPKSTKGPYQWGTNARLYGNIVRQKELANRIFLSIGDAKVRWLITPDPKGRRKVIAWTQASQPGYIFVANLDTKRAAKKVNFPNPTGEWRLCFSTEQPDHQPQVFRKEAIFIEQLRPGEGLVLELSPV